MELPVSSLVHQHTYLLLLLILGGCGGDWWSRGVPNPQERGSPLLRFDPARCLLSYQSLISIPCPLSRYEYEDRLIMGLVGAKKFPDGKETPLVQPLNFRLPVSFHNLYLEPSHLSSQSRCHI